MPLIDIHPHKFPDLQDFPHLVMVIPPEYKGEELIEATLRGEPFGKLLAAGTSFELRPNVLEWIDENIGQGNYGLGNGCVAFKTEDQAIHFKLAWEEK